MKLKGFVYCKVERIGNEIKRLTNHEAFIDRRIKELQKELVAVAEYKARLSSHLEKVKPRLAGEKCWARKKVNDKVDRYSALASWVMSTLADD